MMQESDPLTTQTVQHALAILVSQWPDVFSMTSPKPLAYGIHLEVIRNRPIGISNRSLRRALSLYAKDVRYLQALAIPDAKRVNLLGEVVEPVSERDALRAKLRLKRRS